MPNNNFLAKIQIEYNSIFAPHKATLYSPDFANSAPNDPGTFPIWAGGTIAGDDMVEGYADVLKAVLPADSNINGYTIFKRDTPTDLWQPKYTKHLDIAGTSTATGWKEAVQQTISFRTAGFNLAKLVVLDRATDNLFGRYFSLSGADAALAGFFIDGANGFCGRDGLQPVAFNIMTVDINATLRRAYHIG